MSDLSIINYNDDRKIFEFTPADPVVIYAEDGREILRIRSDGTWVVEPEDAPEAARIFAAEVARIIAFMGL